MPIISLPAACAPGAPLLVGYSGGLDSSVLLHWLAANPAIVDAGLQALHVHHGLQPQADDWAAHCQQVCDGLGIALHIVRVQVCSAGQGLEAAARDARRQAFAQTLQPGQWLALAHHRDDQAETFLLRALRGSGCDGLAAMQTYSQLAGHRVWRPLLEQPRSALHAHARAHGLGWVEDPSNACEDFDRNFLRQQVLPLLAQRWPQAATSLATAATRCAEDASVLAVADASHLQALLQQRGSSVSLPIQGLLGMDAAARARVLRLWLRQQQAPALPGHLHRQLDATVLACAHDRQASIAWATGWQLQRWRDQLYLLPPRPALDPHWQTQWDGRQPLHLPDGSRWHLHGSPGFSQPLRVALRQGGERLRLPGRPHHTALKDCLQQMQLPPWQRPWLPLLFDGAELLAVGGQLLAQGFGPPRVTAGARLVHSPSAMD